MNLYNYTPDIPNSVSRNVMMYTDNTTCADSQLCIVAFVNDLNAFKEYFRITFC